VPNEYVSGSQIVYVRNPDYVPRQRSASGFAGGKRVFVDRVEFRIIPDPATAAALGKGEIDLWEAPPLDLLALLRSQPLTTTRFLKTGGLMLVMRPNHLLPPFNDMHARLTLLAMVNQDDFMAVACGGDAGNMRACHAFLGCSTDARTEAGMDNFLRPDLARARALLRESGYDGRPIVLMQPTNLPLIRDASAVPKQVMEQVGFKVDMQTMTGRPWCSVVPSRTPSSTAVPHLHPQHLAQVADQQPLPGCTLQRRRLVGLAVRRGAERAARPVGEPGRCGKERRHLPPDPGTLGRDGAFRAARRVLHPDRLP
jgi:peptide/nickel transport system substrate-binding protein